MLFFLPAPVASSARDWFPSCTKMHQSSSRSAQRVLCATPSDRIPRRNRYAGWSGQGRRCPTDPIGGHHCAIHWAFFPYETQLGYTMVDAACRESQVGNLKHFVYSSVLHPRIRKLLNHDCKRYVEEYLVESGLNYTIVQPKSYPGSVSGGNAVAIRKSRLPCSVQPAGYILIHGFARSGWGFRNRHWREGETLSGIVYGLLDWSSLLYRCGRDAQ